jgi:hypothetical protein
MSVLCGFRIMEPLRKLKGNGEGGKLTYAETGNDLDS